MQMNINEILEKHIFIATDEVGSIDTCYEELIVAIKEIVEKTLEMAADNAKIKNVFFNNSHREKIIIKTIDKESITNTINQIKF